MTVTCIYFMQAKMAEMREAAAVETRRAADHVASCLSKIVQSRRSLLVDFQRAAM